MLMRLRGQLVEWKLAICPRACLTRAALVGIATYAAINVDRAAFAQVTADDTLSTTVTTTDNLNFVIENGDRAGHNLFHSFDEWSVPTDGSAVFNNAIDIDNIFGRVTGANASVIDGLIQANGRANLFLLNPNGIQFGSGASLNLGGSFVSSTADTLVFDDGTTFSTMDTSATPLLSINVPVGIQWNQGPPNPITLQSSTLTVATGETLSLLGGDVTLTGTRLTAPGGHVTLGGISTIGTVELKDVRPRFSEGLSRSNVTIGNGSMVTVADGGNGSIEIQATELTLSGASELSAGLAARLGTIDAVAGDIVIHASGDMVVGDRSLIANDIALGAFGTGGNIVLNTGALSITGGARIQALTHSTGPSGAIIINANGDLALSGFTEDGLFSGILSRSATETSGAGGNITVNAPEHRLTLTDRGFIGAVTSSRSNGGTIETNVNTLVIERGGQIVTATTHAGNAGDITINATESVHIAGESRAFVPNPFIDLATIDLNVLDFITDFNANVTESGDGGIPYVSVERTPTQLVSGTTILGAAAEQGDYYSFSVTQGGSRVILDIDFGDTIEEDGYVDTKLFLFNQGTGELLDVSDDSEVTDGAGGSIEFFETMSTDSFIDTTLSEAGFYVLGVGAFPSGAVSNELVEGNSPQMGETYTLQASIENQGTEGVAFPIVSVNPDIYNPNVEAASGLFSESSSMGNGGRLTINTPQLMINDGGRLSTDNSGGGMGGDITLNINNVLDIGDSALVSSMTRGRGDAGNIAIETKRLRQVEGGGISSSTLSLGHAGGVRITAGDSIVLTGENAFEELSTIESAAELNSTGNGGRIEIETPVLRVANGAQIIADTIGDGNGGSIDIQASAIELNGVSANGVFRSGIYAANSSDNENARGGSISITAQDIVLNNEGLIGSGTFGAGNAGDITILTERLLLDHRGAIDSDTAGTGNAGEVSILTERLRLNNGGQMGSVTFGAGDGGSMTIEASRSVEVIGQNEDQVASGIFVNPQPNSTGNGGRLTIDTGLLRIIDGGIITASTLGSGDGGDLIINAIDVEVSGVVVDFTNALSGLSVSVDEGGTGNGGNLTLDAESLRVINGGQVLAGNFGEGNAGDMILRVDEIDVSGVSDDGEWVSSISAFSETAFAAGSIEIMADTLRVSDAGAISVSSLAGGDAGNLNIVADQVFIEHGGTLRAEIQAEEEITNRSRRQFLASSSLARIDEDGTTQGNIILTVDELLVMNQNALISASATGNASGGNITISSPLVVGTNNSDLVASAEDGNGGTIQINTTSLLGFELRDRLTPSSDITASSKFGLDGTVEINTPEVVPSSQVLELPDILVDVSPLVRPGCSLDEDQFVLVGRGGLPSNPMDWLEGDRPWFDLRNPLAQGNRTLTRPPQPPNPNPPPLQSPPIQEATGMAIARNGSLQLVTAHSSPNTAPHPSCTSSPNIL